MTAADAARFEKDLMERNNADRRDGSADTDVARAYNDAWYDRGTHVAVVNGEYRTSLVVEPRDGRVPALTPEAARRLAARAESRRQHPADGPEDRSLAERCLSFNAGPPVLPGPYNNYLQLLVFPELRRHRQRDDPRRARRSDRWTTSSRRLDAQVPGRLDWPLGRADARGRHDQLHGQDELPGRERADAPGRALHASQCGHAALRVHSGRPRVVCEPRGESSCP